MSAAIYMLLKFSNRESLLPALFKIGETDSVIKWDAVDGHYNFVVKLKAKDDEFVKMISALEGFESSSTIELSDDFEKDFTYDEDLCYSYLLFETDQSEKQSVMDALKSEDTIAFCSPGSGSYDLVCMISGENFDSIDKKINNQIKNLDNVLRFKQERVIFLDRM